MLIRTNQNNSGVQITYMMDNAARNNDLVLTPVNINLQAEGKSESSRWVVEVFG
jgi:hypothetical protein